MNYTDYSSHFGKDRFMACISHNDYNYKQLDKRKLFLSNLSLNVDNLVIPDQIHSNNVSIINRSGVYEEVDALISTNKTYIFWTLSLYYFMKLLLLISIIKILKKLLAY